MASYVLAFGELLAGAIMLDYGAKAIKTTFAAAPSGSSGATSTGAVGSINVPQGGSLDQTAWAKAFLAAGNFPQTAQNVANIVAWEVQEGGGGSPLQGSTNSATYNPLNTTQPEPGSSVMGGGSSAGVQAYTSWEQGIMANLDVLLHEGSYGALVSDLQNGQVPTAQFGGATGGPEAAAMTTWGTNPWG